MAYGAVLDACVLIPMSLCDVLLRAAQRDLYRLHWSGMILAEVERNLGKLGVSSAKAASRVAAMHQAFGRAEVTGFQPLIAQMPNDPKDRHVLAAAVVAGAQSIVTFNLKHFKTDGTAQQHIQAEPPDKFLVDLYHLHSGPMLEIIDAQAAALSKSGQQWQPHAVLDNLERQECKAFVALLRPHFP